MRADAARNQARVLDAAEQLFRTRDPLSVTMDDVAKAAGIGRATLYRRYPSVSAIAVALLDEHERALQTKLIGGEPPLGPGAEPVERLEAFYAAMVELLETHMPFLLGAETGRERFTTGAYGFWRAHVRSLLVNVPEPETLVDILLAPLAAEVYEHQRRTLTQGQVVAGLSRLARGVLSRIKP